MFVRPLLGMAKQTVKRITVFLKVEQLKRFRTLSEQTGAPVSELIRRCLDIGRREYEKPGKK
jgi:hypothetical protein